MKKILPANRSFALKSLLALAVTAVGANSAMATDGTINFTGEITAASCTVSAGAGTPPIGGTAGNQTIDINLGKVSKGSLSSTGGGGIVAGKNINLDIDCSNASGLNTVMLQFDPRAGSGVDEKNVSLLKTFGVAEGVGIGLYDNNNGLLNLSANSSINATLTDDGTGHSTAHLNLRAGYVANGDTIVVGSAGGTLPFSLTYD